MKKNNNSPYGTYDLNKIDAPKNTGKNQPKAEKISGKGDLRGGKK